MQQEHLAHLWRASGELIALWGEPNVIRCNSGTLRYSSGGRVSPCYSIAPKFHNHQSDHIHIRRAQAREGELSFEGYHYWIDGSADYYQERLENLALFLASDDFTGKKEHSIRRLKKLTAALRG